MGGGGGYLEFIVASIKNNITYSFVPLDKLIYNQQNIKFKQNSIVSKIQITDSIYSGNIKYFILFNDKWYTFKNNEWLEQELVIENIINNGMGSSIVNNITENQYKLLGYITDINFAAMFVTQVYDDKLVLNKISLVTKIKNVGKKIKDNLYDYQEYYDNIEILWKTSNKNEIQIIC